MCEAEYHEELGEVDIMRSPKYDYSRFMELYGEGHTDKEISNELSIPPVLVCQYRSNRNLPANNPPAHVVSRFEWKNLKQHITPEDKDDESLFCDGDFLEQLMQKPIERLGKESENP